MNVWQHKANKFSDHITIKTVEVYHIINFFMQVGMYIYMHTYKWVDCCTFYLHFALKYRVLYVDFNSIIIWLKCTFISTSARDNKTFASILELLVDNRFYECNLKLMEAALGCYQHFKVI